MAKSLIEFNREYSYKCFLEAREAEELEPQGSVVKSTIFYGLLVIAVMVAFFYSNSDNVGQKFGPFAYNTVLTTSMASVYPRGSLVMSWEVKPGEPVQAGLDKGTDIVFVIEKTDENGKNMVVVHRIIEIMDNYEESGQRAFITQGVDNPTVDDWVVYEGNIIGRVTGHVKYLGDILAYIAENIIWVVIAVVMVLALLTLLKIIFQKDTSKNPPEQQEDVTDI